MVAGLLVVLAIPDRTPSLAIAVGKRVPVIVKCMSAGCPLDAILSAMGLRKSDLFEGRESPAVRSVLADRRRLDGLERRLGLLLWAEAQARNEKLCRDAAYYAGGVKRVSKQVEELRDKLDPHRTVIRRREERLVVYVRKFGWDRLWDKFLESEDGWRLVAECER